MYIRDDLNYIIRNDISVNIDGKFESIFVEAHLKTVNCIFGETYRVPNTSEIVSISYYELEHIQKDIVLGTNQNFDYLKHKNQAHVFELMDLFLNASVLLTITKPTRIKHSTATLIDSIYIKQVKKLN
jgi:hypothetical protein